MTHGPTPTYKDPVCGMNVGPTTAAEAAEYQGKTYYFCSGHCRNTFEAEPEQFVHRWRQRGDPMDDASTPDSRKTQP